MMRPVVAIAGFATSALSLPVCTLAEAAPPQSAWTWAKALGEANAQFVLAVVCVFFALAIVYQYVIGHKERDRREDRLVAALEQGAKAQAALQTVIQECHNRTLTSRSRDAEV